MKKAALAGAVMIIMLAISLWNVRHLDRLTDGLETTLHASRERWEQGDAAAAAELARLALEEFYAAEGYTHVFIRHAEVDGAADAFYDLLAALAEGEAAGPAYERVSAHLRTIDAMEHLTLKSVF